jgi:FixJ family two-component response regulator
LGRFIRLAVSPEPERRSRAAAPQGKQREQVEQGSKRELLAARSFLDSSEFPNVSCVVLDVSMPNMNGLELQRHLASTNPIPIIFVTAHGDEKTRERALRAGAIRFLNKPFSDEALIDSLHSALDESG